jgi:polyferredoxin
MTIALIGSVFYTRFWCRYLCAVGAFLSLFNKVVILKRYVPAKKFGSCEFGLTGKDQMDCIYCDRCRYQARTVVKKEHLLRPHHAPAKAVSQYFVVVVLIAAILISTVSVSRFSQVIGAGIGQSAGTQSTGGEPRDVDLQRIRTMIEQNMLSDREAEFYKKVE